MPQDRAERVRYSRQMGCWTPLVPDSECGRGSCGRHGVVRRSCVVCVKSRDGPRLCAAAILLTYIVWECVMGDIYIPAKEQ